jgi:hypothetical protein
MIGFAILGIVFAAGSLLWVDRMLLSGTVDLSIEAATPMARFQAVQLFVVWMAFGSTCALLAAWLCHSLERAEAVASPEAVVSEAARPPARAPRTEPAAATQPVVGRVTAQR